MGASLSKPPDSYSTYISENIQYGERPKTCYNIVCNKLKNSFKYIKIKLIINNFYVNY